MENEMIERVEQALRISLHLASDREREAAKRAARAAIEAMREPTDAMVKEGAYFVPNAQSEEGPPNEEGARTAWEAMIDAALA